MRRPEKLGRDFVMPSPSQLRVSRQHERRKVAEFSRVSTDRGQYDRVEKKEVRESMADRVAKASLELHIDNLSPFAPAIYSF